jgi:hypothetical protein
MVSKQTNIHKINKDEGKRAEEGQHDPSQNIVNFFFSNFALEWNKVDPHELYVEVGEKADLYVVRKVSKVGRNFMFACFFEVGSLRVLENRLNIIRIGNFNLRANIVMFKKPISDSKKESKRD